MQLVASAIWKATSELVLAVDARFGEPVDAYVNGSQVWLRDDGPDGMTLEWRLHPVAGYQRPLKVSTYEVFSITSLALATGEPPPAPLSRLWDGLEVFAAYGDELEPAQLVTCAVAALGIVPDASGRVDHAQIADSWERSGRTVSIFEALSAQLAA